ncbi:MAG: cobalt-precorrin-5B (C(1))-methyltransferase CbiD [Aphanocapsa sp. GSE-SYN-MK-11-07L]|nr:cobalt-precorrin-5B (C(1))-methyltransferase CbiD [Aphanocapsa sp. GSE-SYN-MK-11-07L]
MVNASPRSGYTLPVFACAAALAAWRWLEQPQLIATVSVDLLIPPETVEIPIEQVAGLGNGMALAIARSDPGDNLDLTRDTPIWAMVEWASPGQAEPVRLEGGEGIGKIMAEGRAAIYQYAQTLITTNLERQLPAKARIRVTIILPEGRALGQRTSNSAFGVVEGLSLLGTAGISQPLSAPDQLEVFRADLKQKSQRHSTLVFCIGENGLDLARKMGVPSDCLLKTANWLGPLLVEAGIQGVQSLLLFGYHGKLIKLAGGIFHTHHHLADARQEILTAHCANQGLPHPHLQQILASPTAEAGLEYLRQLDTTTNSNWVNQVYGAIAEQIDLRSRAYMQTHCDRSVTVGCLLFDRSRQAIVTSSISADLLQPLIQLSDRKK